MQETTPRYRSRVEINGHPYEFVATTKARGFSNYSLELRLPNGRLAGYIDVIFDSSWFLGEYPFIPRVSIDMVRSNLNSYPEPHAKNGIGGFLLRELLKMADEAGITIDTIVNPEGRGFEVDGRPNYFEVQEWLGRHGFRYSGKYSYHMARQPNKHTPDWLT